MKCVICKHGETQPARVTVTLERGRTAVVFRTVPAEVCENCGEQYVEDRTARALLEQAEAASAAGVEVEVRSFRAA